VPIGTAQRASGIIARKGVIVDVHQYLRAIPKVSLHCHMEGAMRASTLVELAGKHGVELPPYQHPQDLYDFESIDQFFHA
jgi:adenosine deaminase